MDEFEHTHKEKKKKTEIHQYRLFAMIFEQVVYTFQIPF